MRSASIIVVLLLLSVPTCVKAKSWRGITPLQSTRQVVVPALGVGNDPKKPGTEYSLENEEVRIVYSDKDFFDDCVRQLPIDLVLYVAVTPKIHVNIDTLVVDPKAMHTIQPSKDMPLTTAFIADEEGLVVSVNSIGDNQSTQEIKYLPSKADRSRCPRFYKDLTRFINKIVCVLCPTVVVACPEETDVGNNITFVVAVTVGSPPPKLTFNWTVDGGTIVEGQGTPSITVNTSNVKGSTVTATADVGGIDPSCSRTASCSTPMKRREDRH